MKALDPEQNEYYKFFGCEQVEQKVDDTDAVVYNKRERAKSEKMDKRMKALTSTELYERKLIKAIITSVVRSCCQLFYE